MLSRSIFDETTLPIKNYLNNNIIIKHIDFSFETSKHRLYTCT